MAEHGFLAAPEPTDEVRRLYADDVDEHGYVMNVSRTWGHHPELQEDLFALIGRTVRAAGLDPRRRALLVAACASAFGDAYCSLAWGNRLATATDPDTAAAVLRGRDDGLDPAERAMVGWARKVARDPNATTEADVRALRAAGFDDAQVLAMTVFVSLRLAFATVNDALGTLPDAELREHTPEQVLAAVDFGRPIAAAADTRSPDTRSETRSPEAHRT